MATYNYFVSYVYAHHHSMAGQLGPEFGSVEIALDEKIDSKEKIDYLEFRCKEHVNKIGSLSDEIKQATYLRLCILGFSLLNTTEPDPENP